MSGLAISLRVRKHWRLRGHAVVDEISKGKCTEGELTRGWSGRAPPCKDQVEDEEPKKTDAELLKCRSKDTQNHPNQRVSQDGGDSQCITYS